MPVIYRPLPTVHLGCDIALWHALYQHFLTVFDIHVRLTMMTRGQACGKHALRAGQAKTICESIAHHIEETRMLRSN